ncbi:MAG: serine protease [Chlorobiota bacterium]
MRFILNFLLIAILLTSCSTFSTNVSKKKNLPPIKNDEPIYIFFEKYDELPDSSVYVGDITLDMNLGNARAWGGFPSIDGLLSVLEEDIKKNGGNLLLIDEVGESTRKMVKGKFYLVPDFAKTDYTLKTFEDELKNKELKPLEGIYKYEYINPYSKRLITLKFGVIEVSESEYQMIHLSGFHNVDYVIGLTEPDRTWKKGDIYGYISETEKDNLYEAKMYDINKSLNQNGMSKIDNKNLRIYLKDKLSTYVKIFPDSGRYEFPVGSLTGFALDNKSILTCYHGLTDKDLEIFVKGIHGDFNKKYKAKVIAKDKQLDLAVIQLEDSTISLDNVTFPKAKKEKSISEKVFVLGYPMSTMMGDDIKLTDGLISSTSGIGGSLKEYQISAPIQPGNSGSPSFDDNGNFIGMVNSGIVMADNVGYSIKAKYIEDFLEDQDINFNSTTEDELSELPFVEKVKELKKSIYLIELTDTEPPKSTRNDGHRRRRRR